MADVAAGWAPTACLLLVAQFTSRTHGRQTAETHCLRKSQQQKQRTHGGGAGARVQQKHCIIRCYIYAIHSCLRVHDATQKPSQKPCPMRVPSRRAHECAHTTHALLAVPCALRIYQWPPVGQPPVGQLLQPAAPSAQPFRKRRPLRKPQEAGLRTPACTLMAVARPEIRAASAWLGPTGGSRVVPMLHLPLPRRYRRCRCCSGAQSHSGRHPGSLPLRLYCC